MSQILVSAFLFALANRVFMLGSQVSFISDERYYVKDAWSILNFGYEKSWVQDYSVMLTLDESLNYGNSDFYNGNQPTPLSDTYWSTHPPLGKMLISLGMLFFKHSDSFGWRLSGALFGALTVVLAMLIAQNLFSNKSITILSGLILSLDPLSLTMSRIAYLDIFVSFFITLMVFITLMIIRKKSYNKLLSYVILGSIAGLGASVKWSVIFASVPLIFTLLAIGLYQNKRLMKFLLNGISSVVVAIISYLITWVPWMASYGNSKNIIAELVNDHIYKYNYALLFSGTGPMKTNPFEWLIFANPSFFTSYPILESTQRITYSSMPNPIFWITGLFGISIIGYLVLKKNYDYITGILPLMILWVNFIPWVFYEERIIYQWYAVSYAPLMAVSSAFAMHFLMRQARVANIILISGLILSLIFTPHLGWAKDTRTPTSNLVIGWKESAKKFGLYDVSQADPGGSPAIKELSDGQILQLQEIYGERPQ